MKPWVIIYENAKGVLVELTGYDMNDKLSAIQYLTGADIEFVSN